MKISTKKADDLGKISADICHELVRAYGDKVSTQDLASCVAVSLRIILNALMEAGMPISDLRKLEHQCLRFILADTSKDPKELVH